MGYRVEKPVLRVSARLERDEAAEDFPGPPRGPWEGQRYESQGRWSKVRTRNLVAAGAVVTVAFMMMALAPAAHAAPTTFLDDGGPDDEIGQKDLNSFTVDYGNPGATSIAISGHGHMASAAAALATRARS